MRIKGFQEIPRTRLRVRLEAYLPEIESAGESASSNESPRGRCTEGTECFGTNEFSFERRLEVRVKIYLREIPEG